MGRLGAAPLGRRRVLGDRGLEQLAEGALETLLQLAEGGHQDVLHVPRHQTHLWTYSSQAADMAQMDHQTLINVISHTYACYVPKGSEDSVEQVGSPTLLKIA